MKRSLRAIYIGGGLLVALSILFIINYEIDSALELNPPIYNDAAITGRWSDKDEALTLSANKTFHYIKSGRAIDGTWARDDWNLYLKGSPYFAQMRFIKFRGNYRLVTHSTRPDEMDIWTIFSGLKKD